jgi:hypothetical protein
MESDAVRNLYWVAVFGITIRVGTFVHLRCLHECSGVRHFLQKFVGLVSESCGVLKHWFYEGSATSERTPAPPQRRRSVDEMVRWNFRNGIYAVCNLL